MTKVKKLTWSSKKVALVKIKPTPTNYKIKTELGKARLQQSLKLFGLAGTVVLNVDNTIIDGNSRWEEAKAAGEKFLWCSVPNRKLTPGEFKEMSAMFDYAKAGEVDTDRIKGDLGKTKQFFERWGWEVPLDTLEQLGSGKGAGDSDDLQYPEKKVKARAADEGEVVRGLVQVSLFFTVQQEQAFRKLEDKLAKKFKTPNTTETVLRAMKSIK